MTEKKQTPTNNKPNKNRAVGICIGVIIAVALVIAIIIGITSSKNNSLTGLNEAYFVSDGEKYVLSIETDNLDISGDSYTPSKEYLVYYYSGDSITGLKAFYEYSDNSSAQSAYTYFEGINADGVYAGVELNGKYVILSANSEEYESLTAEDVKNQIELFKQLQNTDLEESNTNK